jgi:site-specific DNA recombinase
LARWLETERIQTSTGKTRWDRSTLWAMIRNPAYAGRAGFAKTARSGDRARVNRTARRQGRAISANPATRNLPVEEWITIPVPPIVTEETFAAAARRLEDNKRFAARNSKEPSLLMGLTACETCGYAYYRTSTRTTTRKIYYYRCLGSDNYRYPAGRVCDNKPVRADYLDDLIWAQVTALLADPAIAQRELDRRLSELQAANPGTAERSRLELDLTRTTAAIERLVQAYQEALIPLDELRARIPELRARKATIDASLAALDAQLLDRDNYLKLAEDLDTFLTRLRDTATTATTPDRQRVLRTVVKEILVGPDQITIRHTIPVKRPFLSTGSRLRWRSHIAATCEHCAQRVGRGMGTIRPPGRDSDPVFGRFRDRVRDAPTSRAGPGDRAGSVGSCRAAPASRQDQHP